jgi:hypothetical protein
MKIRRFATQFQYFLIALVLMGACSGRVLAQDHTHAAAAQPLTQTQSSLQATLLQTVRDATEQFKDVQAAIHAGYQLTFGCVSGPDSGAMGLHFVNFDLVKSGVLDATHPQIVIYEANGDGKLQLIGADFLVLADQWNAAHNGAPPELMGQLFHLFDTPNRFGLPAFYTLHVWAWKENPNGAFVNWHPNVSCQNFSGQ